MSFVSSGNTVQVQAFLTSAGRRKLMKAITGDTTPFITKFAIGDSDTNYAAIDAGYGPLLTGFVPAPGEFISRIRSFALARGSFKPAAPIILFGGQFAATEGHYKQISIGQNIAVSQQYSVKTQWPKNQNFDEDYKVEIRLIDSAGNVTNDSGVGYIFRDFFNVGYNQTTENVFVSFNGGLDTATLTEFIGPGVTGANNGWSVEVRIEGLSSNAVTIATIDFVQ